MSEEDFKSYVSVLLSPEIIKNGLNTLSIGDVPPMKDKFTILQMFMIAISNHVWNYLNGGPVYVYRGLLNFTGQAKYKLFEHCINKLVETNYTDSNGHVWNNNDAAREMSKLNRMIKEWG